MASNYLQDPSKKPEDILTDLINQTNEGRLGYRPFAYGELKFRNVRPAAFDEDRDTAIQIAEGTPESDSDWLDIWYDRVAFSRVLNVESPTLPYKPEYTSVYEMLDAINERFGINVSEADLEDAVIAADPTEFPVTVPMIVKPTSLVYRGATAIYLTDPNSGTGIITPVNTQVDVDLATEFTESGSMVHGTDNTISGFTVADNGEISVACSVALRGNTDPLEYVDGVATYTIADTDMWDLKFNFGLINTVNGDDVGALYDIRLFSPTHGPDDLDLRLYKTPDGYKLSNVNNSIVIDDNTIAPDKSFIQNVISLSDYGNIVDTKSKNAAGAPLGTYEFTLTATRKQGGVPPVVVNFKMQTKSIAKFNFTAISPATELVTIGEGNSTTVTQQFRVLGPAGVPAFLDEKVEVEFEFENVTSELAYSAGGLTFVGNKITIPKGAPKGLYEVTWNVTAIEDSPGPANYVCTIVGGTETARVDWIVADGSVAPVVDPPVVTAKPQISGVLVEGAVVGVIPATYTSSETATVETILRIGGVERELVEGLVELTADDVGKIITATQIITNSGGSVETVSDDYGPIEEADVDGTAPTVTTAPSISGDAEVGATLTLDPGVFAGTAPITYTASIKYGAETVALDPIPATIEVDADWAGETIVFEVVATNAYGTIAGTSDEFGPIEDPGDDGIPTMFDIPLSGQPYSFLGGSDGNIYLSTPVGGKMVRRYAWVEGDLVEDTTFDSSGVLTSPCSFIGLRQNGDVITNSMSAVAILDGTTGGIKAGTTPLGTSSGNLEVLFDETSIQYGSVLDDPTGVYSAVDGATPELFLDFRVKPLSLMLRDTLGGIVVATRSEMINGYDFIKAIAANDETYYGFLRFQSDGSLDTSFRFAVMDTTDQSMIVTPPFLPASAAETSDGYIVGGYHDQAETATTARNGYITRVDRNGAVVPSFVCDVDGPIQYVQKIDTGKYMIVGAFTTVNGVTAKNIAFIDDAGANVQADIFGAFSLPNIEQTIVRYEQDRLMIAGSFTVNGVGPQPRFSGFKVDFTV